MRAKCTLLAAAGALALAASAGSALAAHAGSVKVRSVSVPRTATAGMPVDVKVSVARAGGARVANLSFYQLVPEG
jgi:uncharacterized protein (DUF58 family)